MADRIILPRATDSNGDIVSGAKAYFYEPGTSTPLVVYSDEAGTTPVSPPLLADSEGVFAATFTTQSVKVNITDTADVDLPGFPSDPHPISQASGTGAASVTFSPITGNAATNVQAAIKVVTDLWNAVTTFGKSLIAAADKAAARVVLGIGGATPTAGDLLYYNGTNFVELGVGAAGQALVTNSGATAPEWAETYGETAAQTLNTETAVDFTTIPSWATKIEVILSSASLSGSDDILVQLGDSGGIEVTGYDGDAGLTNGGATGSANETTGFPIRVQGGGRSVRGTLTITKEPSENTWTAGGNFALGSGIVSYCAGEKTLSDTLTQLRVTRDGTDTFDGGTVSVRWRM